MLYTRATNGHNEKIHDISYYDNNDVIGYDSYGNLTHQTNGVSGALESYTYDKLHRLTKSDLAYSVDGFNATQTINYAYDVVGNILKKTYYSLDSNSAYTYQSGTNKIHSISLKDNTTVYFGYDNSGNQISRGPQANSLTSGITYNAFNKPTVITKNQQNINLFYGADLMRYKQTKVVDNQIVTTWYIGKHFEIEEGPHNTTYRHFISDIAIVNTYSNQLPDILFTHRDRLGSAVTMTNEHDIADIRRYFDPFGKPRVGTDWSLWESISLPARLMNLPGHEKGSYKGFTDHEHLDEAELIHMNGRVYDYNVGRFMSVDPVIQSPGNSQSINPYSYIMNNPLSGTDPTGYVSALVQPESNPFKESQGCTGIPEVGCVAVDIENIGFNAQNNGSKNSDINKSDVPTVDINATENSLQISEGLISGFTYGWSISNVDCSSCHPPGAISSTALNPDSLPMPGSLLLDSIPFVGSGKSGAQLLTGTDLVTGSDVNRIEEGAGLLLGAIPFGKLLTKGDDYFDFYHATQSIESTASIRQGIDLSKSRNNLDFGSEGGFYTTTKLEQAEKWAKNNGTVLHFRVKASDLAELDNLNFQGSTASWARFVAHNRLGGRMHSHDTVSGPMLKAKNSLIKVRLKGLVSKQAGIHKKQLTFFGAVYKIKLGFFRCFYLLLMMKVMNFAKRLLKK